MQKIKSYIIVVLILVMVLPISVLATNNPPSIPLTIYGDVKIDNNIAPINTMVSVFNSNTEVARTIINKEGKYFIEVGAENKGQILTYKINGSQAIQAICADPLSIPSVRLDLAIFVVNSNITSNIANNSNTSTTNSSASVANSSQNQNSSNSSVLNNSSEPIVLTNTNNILTPAVIVKIEPQVLEVKINANEEQVNKIFDEAKLVSERKLASIVSDLALEKNIEKKYFKTLTAELKINTLTSEQKSALIEFITYGTKTTKGLGMGERAGVIGSYKSAFGKLPSTEAEWTDAIKIANGRWPNERNAVAEKKAKTFFKKIYGRAIIADNQNDNTAITIIAYGLRPTNRKIASEKSAILSFKYIFKYAPISTSDWDTVRAIAYSGAKR